MHSPQLTNRKANLPLNTLYEIPNILTSSEKDELTKAIDKQYYRQWAPEGYDRRHRVQRYVSTDNDSKSNIDNDEEESSTEEVFGWLFDRIASQSQYEMHRPFEVIAIEHTPTSCQSTVNVFEELQLPQTNSDSYNSDCVAQLTLMNNAIQSIEKPVRRELECWDIAEPIDEHETKIIMKQNSIIVKRGESLWNWRGRISNIQTNDEIEQLCQRINDNLNVEKKVKKKWTGAPKLNTFDKRCIILTFRCISQPISEVTSPQSQKIPKQVKPILPLHKLLTIIVTTSPIRSNPSTEMLEETFATFPFAGDEFAYQCNKVIICDGYRIFDDDNGDSKEEKKEDPNATNSSQQRQRITRKHSNDKQALRSGITTIEQAKSYTDFKSRLRTLCEEANEPSQTKNPFRNTQVVELEERHGYGFALRHALYHCVDTPYVCVIQHDRTFMRQAPIKEVVSAMENDPDQKIKYVGMSMRSNLMYYDIFSGKYGRRAVDEFKQMILRPEDLCIGGNIYGADGKSVENMIKPKTEKRKHCLQTLMTTYRGSHQYITYNEQTQQEKAQGKIDDGFHQLTLTPTLFWYDNTHITLTAHYRDFIFNPQYKMVSRGGFVEDKLSPCLVRSCERLGLTDGHEKFGCYLLDDHSANVFTGHIDGGSYMTACLHKN